MDAITYSLRCGQNNSQQYYSAVREFTDKVLVKAGDTLEPIAADYIDYLHKYGLEEVRAMEEYILELLSFCVLWRAYAGIALKVRKAPFLTMSHLAEWRKKHQRVKPYIDIARGVLSTAFLLPEKPKVLKAGWPSLEDIDHVCKWFEATGEFREQALRFVRWRAHWQMKQQEELTDIFAAIHNFTTWFIGASEQELGMYTANVEKFLKDAPEHYRWREDRISCTRHRSEYHLNMVGAELMNRAFRSDFEKTERKAVLLPGCMRGRSAEECKASKVPGGLRCEGCLPECRVNQLREMGKKNNFETFIIPHASDLSLWGPRKGETLRGVIASACLTTLVEGGWELKRY
ncbi:MAG: DUF116 domain-containing protein, partial [Methanococcaceae archaeon]